MARAKEVVPQPQIQGQARIDAPIVLDERRVVVVTRSEYHHRVLRDGGGIHCSQQVTGIGIAGGGKQGSGGEKPAVSLLLKVKLALLPVSAGVRLSCKSLESGNRMSRHAYRVPTEGCPER